jgi:hypothetical protein
LTIYDKRLERGEFRWPKSGKPAVEVTAEQLLPEVWKAEDDAEPEPSE